MGLPHRLAEVPLATKNPADRWSEASLQSLIPESGGTDAGVRAVEEQPHHEQNGHTTSSGYQPRGKVPSVQRDARQRLATVRDGREYVRQEDLISYHS